MAFLRWAEPTLRDCMDNTHKFDNIVDRDKAYNLDGELVYSNRLEDEISLDEYDEIKTQLWNEIVLPEFEQIFCEIDPAYNQIQIEKDSVKKVEKWFEFDEKYRASAVHEWKKRYYTFRYIDGYFYSFCFGPGLILYDNFDFERWLPKQFAPQVQRWIEGDLEIAGHLEKKLIWTQIACSVLGTSLIIAIIVLIVYL